MAFVFGLQNLKLIEFITIFQLKGLKPKNKDHTIFYECCDLTKKVFLWYIDAVIKVLCNDGNDMNKELFLRTLLYVYSK